MPTAKGLDRRIFNSSKSCRGGGTYSKAVTSIVVLWQAGHVEDAAHFRYKLALCERPLIRINKERSQTVATNGDKTQHCSDWAEHGPSATHNNV